MTRHCIIISLILMLNMFNYSFLPSTKIEWSLDLNIKNSESSALFKKCILAVKRTFANSIFHCHNFNGLKLITKLRLELSHPRFHKYRYNFQDTLNLICNCGTVQTTIHHLLHCPSCSVERIALFKLTLSNS